MDIKTSAITPASGLTTPSAEDWEAVRYFVTKLWHQEQEKTNNVVRQLKAKYCLNVTYVTHPISVQLLTF